MGYRKITHVTCLRSSHPIQWVKKSFHRREHRSLAGRKLRELTMRVSRNLFSVALASLLLGASAFAAPATKGTLKLFEPVTVQGKQLAPGQYTVEWNGEGPNVQLTIASGKNEVANVPAH